MDSYLYLFFFFLTEYNCLPGESSVEFFAALCWNAETVDEEGINANGLWEGVLSNSGKVRQSVL